MHPPDVEHRVLVLAPTGRDAHNATALITKAGLPCRVCRNVEELCTEASAGVGAVLLTEEALAGSGREHLVACLRQQPPWSDLPFVVLTRGGPDSPAGLRAMQTLGNVILLERPVRISTCLTAISTALRVRERQYQTRHHLGELQDAERRKDEFLAMLAHELRNPLAPIRNSARLLKMSRGEEPEVRFAVDVVDRQVSNLSRLVDDLLDVSRITSGKVALVRETAELSQIVHRGVEISRSLIESKQQRLKLDLEPAPRFVHGDVTRLTQVVSNLLNNASKFTPVGGNIEVETRMEGDRLVLLVRDDGVGISPQVLGRVFELFVQEDSTLDRSQGGLGIGLTLVRKLVEMHGGEVEAASGGPGRGAAFTVRLPRTAPPATVDADDSRPALRSAARRIVVVDDNVDSAESLGLLLRSLGHQVCTAHDGVAALALLGTYRPDVCILDIGLPRMDGYEVARRLRDSMKEDAPVLVALSGYGPSDDAEKGRAFDHHMVKPVRPELLLPVIAGAVPKRAKGTAATDPS